MKVKLFIVFLLLVCAGSVDGCGKSRDELQVDAARTKREPDKESMEPESFVLPEADSENTTEREFPDDIFYWDTREYFYLLEGEWVAAEYAGEMREYHFDEAWEEGYQEEQQKYTDEVIEKYLGSEYRVEMDNLLYFGPYADLSLILEDNDELFNITRFIPGEFIKITPPYIALSAHLADKEEWYQFIIDADGTVLIEIEYCFFRLERKEGPGSAAVNNEEDDTDYIFYLEDEGVRDNPVFAAFIDKEITAYDAETEENRYIYQCFRECYLSTRIMPPVYGVHYMAEDLDGDGSDELLVLLQWNDTDGDLLVFHEEDGKLYQWETWEYFMWMRMLEIKYHGNGIFSMGGGAGDIVGRYNAEGKIEYIAKCLIDFGYTEEDEFWESYHLILYKDGQEEKELNCEGIYSHDDDTLEMTPENQANFDEIVAIMHKIWEEIGEGRRIEDIEYEEDVKKIPLYELFDQEEGMGPDGIFYWGAEEYFYLLEGEWIAAEYAGTIKESIFDEIRGDDYRKEKQERTNAVIEKYLGTAYCIERDNLLYFGPYKYMSFVMKDNGSLFTTTGFVPGEFITINPPYIGLYVQPADKEEAYPFIIDADGTVLIEIENHFFRLERKQRRMDKCR